MIKKDTEVRLNLLISTELNEELKQILPYGMKAEITRQLLRAFIRNYHSSGPAIIGRVLTGKIDLEERL